MQTQGASLNLKVVLSKATEQLQQPDNGLTLKHVSKLRLIDKKQESVTHVNPAVAVLLCIQRVRFVLYAVFIVHSVACAGHGDQGAHERHPTEL